MEIGRKMLPAACLATAIAAVGGEPLTLAEAARQALDGEPGRLALLEQAAAFDELATAAAQLPDPQLRLGVANLPLEAGGFRTEGMSQALLGVRQLLPPRTERKAARRGQLARAEERRAQADARGRQVLLEARNAWLDASQAAQSRVLLKDSQALFANLVAVTRSLYAVGGKNQQDVLAAELQLGRLQTRLIAASERENAARTTLERWIGNDASRPLAPLLAWPRPPSFDLLRANLAEHPALLATAAQVAVGNAEVAAARARFRPHWAVDAAYGYRDGGLPDGSPRSDFFSITASVSAPLFADKRQRPALRAAEARRRSAAADQQALRLRLFAGLAREHRRWQDLDRRLAHLDVVLGQADATAQAALAAYRSRTANFAAVMHSHIDQLEVRLARLQVAVDRRRSHVELAYLGGFPL